MFVLIRSHCNLASFILIYFFFSLYSCFIYPFCTCIFFTNVFNLIRMIARFAPQKKFDVPLQYSCLVMLCDVILTFILLCSCDYNQMIMIFYLSASNTKLANIFLLPSKGLLECITVLLSISITSPFAHLNATQTSSYHQ